MLRRLLDEGPVSWVVYSRVQLLVLPESSWKRHAWLRARDRWTRGAELESVSDSGWSTKSGTAPGFLPTTSPYDVDATQISSRTASGMMSRPAICPSAERDSDGIENAII